jgi:predicted DCC family thiol-disulfide oxidoreductase YuxK
MLHQHLELGAEHQRAVVEHRVIHGLDAHPVAGHEEGLAVAVPQGEGKHAAEALTHASPQDSQAWTITSVSLRVWKRWPRAFELGHQLLEVVDLAVEDHGHRAVFVEQGLLPAGKVDDGQTAVRQRDARLKVISALVRPTVKLDVVHALHEFAREGLFRSCIEKSGNAAHSC